MFCNQHIIPENVSDMKQQFISIIRNDMNKTQMFDVYIYSSINNNVSNYTKKIYIDSYNDKFIMSNSVIYIAYNCSNKCNTIIKPNCIKHVIHNSNIKLPSKKILSYKKKDDHHTIDCTFSNTVINTIFIQCLYFHKNNYFLCENVNNILVVKTSKKMCFIKNVKYVNFLEHCFNSTIIHNDNLCIILRNICYLCLRSHFKYYKFLKNNYFLKTSQCYNILNAKVNLYARTVILGCLHELDKRLLMFKFVSKLVTIHINHHIDLQYITTLRKITLFKKTYNIDKLNLRMHELKCIYNMNHGEQNIKKIINLIDNAMY